MGRFCLSDVMLPHRLEVAGSIVSAGGEAAPITGGSTGSGMSTVNVPKPFSKVGMVAGAEGFEVTGRRKTGSFDMPVTTVGTYCKPALFCGVGNHFFGGKKKAE